MIQPDEEIVKKYNFLELLFCSHFLTILPKSSETSFSGLLKRTPFAFAAAIPSLCRLLMFSRSLCATKDKICSIRSAIKIPIKSLSFLVSSTQMSMPVSFVSQGVSFYHCFLVYTLSVPVLAYRFCFSTN